MPEARSDTFKAFREWLHQKFAVGYPTEEEWGQIMVDDKDYQYHQQPYNDPEYNGNERGGEYIDPQRDYGAGMENNVLGQGGYNPEMHAFLPSENQLPLDIGVHSFIIHY